MRHDPPSHPLLPRPAHTRRRPHLGVASRRVAREVGVMSATVAFRPSLPCLCCRRMVPDANPRQPLHLDCWTEHHSDPTEVWPPDHRCAFDPGDPCDECGTPTEPCPHSFALCDLHRTLRCQPCADERQADTRDDAAIDARREGL